ncbi:ABC transporter ATP-binding protein [Cellulomonas citrea]|uniref:ABC transporter ATP-binding protein n=1 Tax=Cellulomonas citrea TaxID=1909423 RepID=UPI00135A1BC4|nr:ABC transporter ATP-binding protein [Cellulomonas citrea]
MSDPLVEALGASRRFGALLAVDDVSLAVRPGEVVGLLGANGAGKTTLLTLLLGLLAPSAGAVRLCGAPPSREGRRRVGYVPQNLGLYDSLTVAENLEFIAGAYGTPVPTLPDGLAPLARTPVGSIGLGNQRRLAFVAALGHAPALLVLDEPTSGVDPLARARLWDTIREQAQNGAGVLVTTHYLQEARQCDRLVLMVAGRAVAAGSEADLVGDLQAVQVRTPVWQEAFAALTAAQLPVVLEGTGLRVADVPVQQVRAALAAAQVPAEVEAVPARLEEVMAARAAR